MSVGKPLTHTLWKQKFFSSFLISWGLGDFHLSPLNNPLKMSKNSSYVSLSMSILRWWFRSKKTYPLPSRFQIPQWKKLEKSFLRVGRWYIRYRRKLRNQLPNILYWKTSGYDILIVQNQLRFVVKEPSPRNHLRYQRWSHRNHRCLQMCCSQTVHHQYSGCILPTS